MAENKKSFILYSDLIHTVRKMPKEKAGELFLTILQYVNDENPTVNDILVDLVFEPIKQQLKRDLVKWEVFKEKQSENGKKGGRPKKDIPLIENPNNPSLILESQKSLNVNDNVSVNEIVNDIDTYIELRKNIFNEYDTELKTKLSKYKIDRPICFIGNGIPVMYYDLVEILVICINDIEWQKDIQNRFGLLKYEKSLIDFFLTIKASSEYTKYKGENDFKRHYTNWLNKNTDKYKK